MDYKQYLLKLEQALCSAVGTLYNTQIICKGVDKPISIDLLQGYIDTDKILIISYYGIVRRSNAFIKQLGKEVVSYIINFNQIKIEHLIKLDSTLINDFFTFKQKIVEERFKNV